MNTSELTPDVCPGCGEEYISKINDTLPKHVWFCKECECFYYMREVEMEFTMSETEKDYEELRLNQKLIGKELPRDGDK